MKLTSSVVTRSLTIGLVVAAVVGCGQPGPLYLPTAASLPAKAASAPPPSR